MSFFSKPNTWFKSRKSEDAEVAFTHTEMLQAQLRTANARINEWRNLSLNYSAEVRRLQYGLIKLREGIEKHAYDTVWYSNHETAVDFITALLNGEKKS